MYIMYVFVQLQFLVNGFQQCEKSISLQMGECVNTVCLGFSYEFIEFSQSVDFPSLACLHMPSGASAHAQ